VSPYYYTGTIRVSFDGTYLASDSFEIVLVSQTAHNLAEYGTWCEIRPDPNASGRQWGQPETTFAQRYVTGRAARAPFGAVLSDGRP
jgi:hypothetical protein